MLRKHLATYIPVLGYNDCIAVRVRSDVPMMPCSVGGDIFSGSVRSKGHKALGRTESCDKSGNLICRTFLGAVIVLAKGILPPDALELVLKTLSSKVFTSLE